MRQSHLFGKTQKQAPKDEVSVNARLLAQGGFINKLTAGVYTYLPLGLRVLKNIQAIVRQEMEAIGGQEILMPALHPKENWQQTGRWDDPGTEVMFQFEGRSGKQFGLGWTHEEIITPLVKNYISSYKDLPLALYQIQDKFRNEPRAKSGLMRGIEFSMKDLYSFHRSEADLEEYYQKALEAYGKIFQHCGLDALATEASGGTFAQFSHEFQVLTEYGEDTIFYCPSCRYAQNKEIATLKSGDHCPRCSGTIMEATAIEVGNVFQLKTKYSTPFKLEFTDQDGSIKPVLMGCYGIGPSRVMGAIVEVHHDAQGIIWPQAVAPFQVHLIGLGTDSRQVQAAEKVYAALATHGIDVLYDDRLDSSAGQKFADADLLGIPYRLVVSAKTGSRVEVKQRQQTETTIIPLRSALGLIRSGTT